MNTLYLFLIYWVIYCLIYLTLYDFALSCKAVGSCFEDEIAADVFPFEDVLYVSMFHPE